MRKLIAVTLLLLLITPCLRAQRKEFSQARSYIKSGKNLDKAENLMKELLAQDSLNKRNAKIYDTWYQAVRKQYDIENEKLYLNQKCDTAKVYSLTKRILDVMLLLDSVDVLPQENGKIKPKYRKNNSKEMHDLRPNLFYGGTFFINKSDYNIAFMYFDAYISCKDKPFFESFNYAETDANLTEAAYWATYCGYKAGDAGNTLKYAEMALQDTAKQHFVLSYIAEAHIKNANEDLLLNVLMEGFSKYPLDPYFFPRLVDYYNAKGQSSKALTLANEALEVNPAHELFLFAKSSLLLNLERYDECIGVSDTLIALNPTLPEPYFNAGMSYYIQAQQVEMSLTSVSAAQSEKQRRLLMASKKEQVSNLCRKSLPYMEKYRTLSPNSSGKWAPALYKIYLNLNMGKQFDEIDAILNHH